MEITTIELLGFAMVLTRLSVFFIVAPIFSWQTIPPVIKITIVLFLTIFFSVNAPLELNAGKVSLIEAILLLSNEAVYGLALGLITILMFSVIKLSGSIIENEMGFTMASTLDPFTGESGQPLSRLLEVLFILLFLSANGHHLLLLVISKSYQAFPSGHIPDLPVLLDGVLAAGTTMLAACLRLAAPMLAAFLLLLVVLAVFARIMPDMDILFISMPLRAGLGLMMIGIFLPFINQFVGEFADWMGKLLPL
jgi:flagellar biosynthetic protein FliR